MALCIISPCTFALFVSRTFKPLTQPTTFPLIITSSATISPLIFDVSPTVSKCAWISPSIVPSIWMSPVVRRFLNFQITRQNRRRDFGKNLIFNRQIRILFSRFDSFCIFWWHWYWSYYNILAFSFDLLNILVPFKLNYLLKNVYHASFKIQKVFVSINICSR